MKSQLSRADLIIHESRVRRHSQQLDNILLNRSNKRMEYPNKHFFGFALYKFFFLVSFLAKSTFSLLCFLLVQSTISDKEADEFMHFMKYDVEEM